MGRTNHYACEKKTDCTISDDAANTNNLLLFNGTDAKERELAKAISTAGSSCSWKPTDAITDSNSATLWFSVNDCDGHREQLTLSVSASPQTSRRMAAPFLLSAPR
jgi:hypothetical protein